MKLFWGDTQTRRGWMIVDHTGRIVSEIPGPSICTRSGGGPVKALLVAESQGHVVDQVEIPYHADSPIGICDCHFLWLVYKRAHRADLP